MSREPAGHDEPRPEESGSSEDWDDIVLDESFVRGAEVSEPTARTRMLSERWKDGGPDPQPWRSDTPPAGWIHGSGRGRGRGGKPRRRGWFRRKGGGSGE